MNRQQNRRTKTDDASSQRGYRTDYVRRRLLQKSFKGNEKGYKAIRNLAETLHTGLEVLWRQKLLCDVELVTSDRKHFYAHKIVLTACCDYFYDIFVENEELCTDTRHPMEVEGVCGSTFDAMLEAMYTGKIKIEATNVESILSAASFLGMFSAVDSCEEFLFDHLNTENCLQLLGTSFKYGLSHLTNSAMQVAATNFLTTSRRPLFRDLPVKFLTELLKRNDLTAKNELDVFHCIRTWIEADKPSRLQHAADLLATVRLPLLTPAEVVDKVECYSYLMEEPNCQRMIKECLHYHLMPARQCLLQSSRTVPRMNAVLSIVTTGGAPRLDDQPIRDDVMRFDFTNNIWETVTHLPAPRHHHAVAVLNGFLYIAGGEERNGVFLPAKSLFRFDPRTGAWMIAADMHSPRQSFQLGVLNNLLYAVGGRISAEESLSSVERYDPSTDKWEEVAQLCSPRRCAAVSCMNGRIYAVGGSGNKALCSRVERYTPSDNKWELLKPINKPRFHAHLVPINNNLYLVGGASIDARGQLICVDAIERFSLETNQWTFVTQLRNPRSEFGCCVVKETLYILGGYDWNTGTRLSDVSCYDTSTKAWMSLPDLKESLTGIGASTLVLYEKYK